MPPLAIAAGIGAIGSIAGGAIASSGANKAADTQAAAANNAANLQYQASQNALNFNKQQFDYQKQIAQPWLNTGASANYTLASLMGLPYPQAAPTAAPGTVTNASGGITPTQNVLQGNASPTVNPYRGYGSGLPEGGYQASPALLAAGGGVEPSAKGPIVSGARGLDSLNSASADNLPDTARLGVAPEPATAATATPASGPLAGAAANTNLQPGLLTQGWTQQFQPPTTVNEQNDPGFQFRLQQGQQALERSAAARGGLLSGGTAKALDRYTQDYASNEYNNTYNRSLGQYQQNYNIFKQNQNDLFNRYASLAGMGQTSAGQLNSAAANAAGNNTNILLGSANAIGNQMNNAAAARASGYAGTANAIGGALSGGANSLAQYLTLQSLLGGNNNSNTGGSLPLGAG